VKRNWTVEQKTAIVLQGLKGDSAITEVCRQHGITTALYYQWRDKFLEGGQSALATKRNSSGKQQELQSKVRELERIIGKLTVQNEILKKTEELLGR
jgi:transposase-like protein